MAALLQNMGIKENALINIFSILKNNPCFIYNGCLRLKR